MAWPQKRSIKWMSKKTYLNFKHKIFRIEKQRMMKNELQKAIQKFNFKIKAGLKYLTQLKVIDPEEYISLKWGFNLF